MKKKEQILYMYRKGISKYEIMDMFGVTKVYLNKLVTGDLERERKWYLSRRSTLSKRLLDEWDETTNLFKRAA